MGRPSPTTPEQDLQIVALYQQGVSRNELSRRFNASRRAIDRRIDLADVKRKSNREASRLHNSLPVNHSAFAAPLSNEALYWIGFLLADGCIDASRFSAPYVILRLSIEDIGHVRQFKSFLKAEHAVGISEGSNRVKKNGTTIRGGPMASIAVSSEQLAADLALHGVVPQKTKRVCVPTLGKNPHVWRGLIDGDGSLHIGLGHMSLSTGQEGKRRPVLQLTGTLQLAEQFADYATETVGATARPHRDHGNWAVSLTCGPCVRMVRHLYTPNCVALERKAFRATQILAQFSADD